MQDRDAGRLQVTGSTAAYFDVFDDAGTALSRRRLNESLDLLAGRYEVRVNHSSHYVEIESGRLARCATGTLIVTGYTGETYVVADSANHPLSHAALGEPVSLFPGSYRASINNTALAVTVQQGELATARTGALTVRGTTAEIYYVLDRDNQQLGHARLERSLAFFPGVYVIKVNNTSMKASIFAGGKTELVTGNILVNGLTDEYYYVTDSAGNALNYQNLNRSLAFFPGHYVVSVNNTIMNGSVSAGDTTEFVTGSLVFKGPGTSYYYVLDEAGNQLANNTLNRALSFFPGLYAVKLGASIRRAEVEPGALEVIRAFE